MPRSSKLLQILFAIGFIFGGALTLNALTYLNFDPNYSFLQLKQKAISTGWYLPAYYSHVLVGSLILIAGFIQIHPTFGRRWKKLHRALGYFYISGILFFAAPGGLIMSFFIERGPWVLLSFVTQASLWFYFTLTAFNFIRNRDIVSHRNWMVRSFALTFAAITLRIYIFICSYGIDLSQPIAYATLAWLSWVPNLAIVELFFIKQVKTPNFTDA